VGQSNFKGSCVLSQFEDSVSLKDVFSFITNKCKIPNEI
jgi:hypothetical protein